MRAIIGAAFSEYVDWRWIGWKNLPIIAPGVVLAFFFLHLRSIDRSFRSRIRHLDWIGMVLYTVGSVLFALPLSWAGPLYRWSSWRTTFLLSLGVVTDWLRYIREQTNKAGIPSSEFSEQNRGGDADRGHDPWCTPLQRFPVRTAILPGGLARNTIQVSHICPACWSQHRRVQYTLGNSHRSTPAISMDHHWKLALCDKRRRLMGIMAPILVPATK